MKCQRCQAENREGRRFCAECAAPLAVACPSCGFANERGEKFCGGCAAPLTPGGHRPERKFPAPESYTPKHLAEKILTSKSALEGERKQVTVLFADLKGSMELLADRDLEEARRLRHPILERMMGTVHRYEGTVDQVMGRQHDALRCPARPRGPSTPCRSAHRRVGFRIAFGGPGYYNGGIVV
jgi:hypothetical protein